MRNLFPETSLTKTEEDILVEVYSNPVVQKHLRMMAYNIGADLVTAVPDPNESAESWIRKEVFLKGQLDNINTLLGISAIEIQAPQS